MILAAVAALAAVSCGQEVAETTAITGNIGDNAPEEVEIIIKDANYDIAVPVTDGKFSVEVPTYLNGTARFKAGNIIGTFVADGTPLNITINEDKSLNVVSKYPKISTQVKYNEYQNGMIDLQKLYQPQIEAATSEEVEDKLYDSYQADVKKLCLDALNGNKDNVVAVSAIENLQYLLDNNQMDSLLATVSPAIAEVASVQKIAKVVTAKKATAEGTKFTDFEVGGQKLSDYVGKGKYILVDFWASWCGPCKAEVPNIKNVYGKYAGKDFDVLGVAVWDKADASAKAVKDLGMGWNQILNAQSVPTDAYGIQGIPHIILFGPDGTIVKRGLRGEEIEAEVAKHVQPVK